MNWITIISIAKGVPCKCTWCRIILNSTLIFNSHCSLSWQYYTFIISRELNIFIKFDTEGFISIFIIRSIPCGCSIPVVVWKFCSCCIFYRIIRSCFKFIRLILIFNSNSKCWSIWKCNCELTSSLISFVNYTCISNMWHCINHYKFGIIIAAGVFYVICINNLILFTVSCCLNINIITVRVN